MKKFFLLSLVAALALPGVALAAVTSSPHDVSTYAPAIVTQGICSPCHIPHGAAAGGSRLFPVAPGTASQAGAVGLLCSACHDETQGAYRTQGTMAQAANNGYVFNAASHAVQNVIAEYPDGGSAARATLNASGLPYTTTAGTNTVIECTSCHNVHNTDTGAGGFRPFLRSNLIDLCQKCHPNRHGWSGAAFVQGQAMGTWNVNYSRTGNPGTHPVGTNVTDALTTTATITFANVFQQIPGAAYGAWVLGGHLSDNGTAGGTVCTTCHAVHGANSDAGGGTFNGTAHAPYTNFLVIAQTTALITYTTPATLSRSVANGSGGNNLFCEGCHSKALGAGYTVVSTNTPTAVDPGTTGYTHPLDGIDLAGGRNWVSTFPTNWPLGNTTQYNTGDPTIAICESCHVVHPAANRTAAATRPDVMAGANQFILRDTMGTFCNRCHSTSATNHHPAGKTYNSSGVAYLPLTTGAAGDTLTCGTCHSGAHNWPGVGGVGIVTGWLPANNARFSTAAWDARGSGTANVYVALSQTCNDCHFAMDGSATTRSPTLGASSTVRGGNAEFTVLGDGTHFMGFTGATGAGLVTELAPQLAAVYTLGTPWTAVAGGGSGWSRFRNNATGQLYVVCESCHELQPLKNSGTAKMLLANFTEGSDGNADGAADGRDQFCEACHLPAGTHPLTGDSVDRTGQALNTNIAASRPWLANIAARTDVTYALGTGPGLANGSRLSCDSCHQVHDAETDSANMILEAQAADIPAGAGLATANANTVIAPAYPDLNKGPAHTAFCIYCHAY